MAQISEEERKRILGKNYTPPDPNAPEERNMFSFVADIVRALFGKKSRA